MRIFLSDAIKRLRPGACWSLHGDEYSGLEWVDDQSTKPTEKEVNDMIFILEQEWKSKEYQRLRAAEYPSTAEQFDLLYHGGYDEWKAKIDEVKNKYPKPESN